MHERHEHVTRAEPGVAAEQVDLVATDPYDHRRNAAYKARQAIYFIFGIVEGLIAIRFILRALGANPDAGFAASASAGAPTATSARPASTSPRPPK